MYKASFIVFKIIALPHINWISQTHYKKIYRNPDILTSAVLFDQQHMSHNDKWRATIKYKWIIAIRLWESLEICKTVYDDVNL